MINIPQILQELHSLVLRSLIEDSNTKNCVANIYDYLPSNPSLPYVKLHTASYQVIPNLVLKTKLIFDIYSFQMQNLFAIMENINRVLSVQNFEHLDCKIIALNSGTIDQHDDVLHASMNLNILLKRKCND